MEKENTIHEVVSSESSFLQIIKELPNKHLQTLISIPQQSAGVIVEGLEFSYFPNPAISTLKKQLLNENIVKELTKYLVNSLIKVEPKLYFVQFINCVFDDSIILFDDSSTVDLTFSNCSFSKPLLIPKTSNTLTFVNTCVFKEKLSFASTDKILTFVDCIFKKEVMAKDKTFKNKVRFRNCDFIGYANFRNTTFEDLADFWRCTFYQKTIFYKTDFLDTIVFSAVTFMDDVLFTYALIDKLMILRGTDVEKGFDISLAIISGRLSIFDFKLKEKNYKSYKDIYKDAIILMPNYQGHSTFLKAYEEVYEKAVSEKALIPIENKRETYRILKSQLDSQKNYIDAVPYRVMEHKTYLKESWKKFWSRHQPYTRPFSNIIVLSLNGISNWFGSSYIIGIIFTVSIAAIFFNSMLSHISDFVYTTDIREWQWEYFVQFLNPAHKFDFMNKVDENPRTYFYIFDFLGRIFIGYGIYQTVQAFRKYK
ncbi:pentapeptide repeat-containing protein [Winogradskyella sp.]|uniref:pentapeptide repeat-containing protein n=1 Tax=Winogradskyella sp. TaxID=1883156 RepID=UPI00262CD182|nr:pentapeptide repeat-containing protein [Winogradskyella sp.]